MDSSQKRHRHFVLSPVIAVILVLSFYVGDAPLTASVADSFAESGEYRIINFSGGVQSAAKDDARIEEMNGKPVLLDGAAIIKGQGIFEVSAGRMDITGISGAIYASLFDGEVTLSAITSPVLAEIGSSAVLVPVNYMWRSNGDLRPLKNGLDGWMESRGLKRIPFDFKQDILSSVSDFPEFSESAKTDLTAFSKSILSDTFPFLLIPRSESGDETAGEDILSAMESYVGGNDWEQFINAMDDPESEEVFSSRRGRMVLSRLLEKARENKRAFFKLVSVLAKDEKIELIMLMHPDYRSLAWDSHSPKFNGDRRALFAFNLPKSDILPEPVPPYILRGWREDIEKEADSLKKPELLIEAVSKVLLSMVDAFEKDGYPLRAQNYSEILFEWKEKYSAISSATSGKIEELRAQKLVPLDALDKALSAGSSANSDEPKENPQDAPAKEPVLVISPDETKNLAYSILQEQGALFTAETAIDPQPGMKAEVKGIVFETPSGNLSFDLTLDVSASKVSSVSINGETMPFRMPIGEFVKWVKAGGRWKT